MCPGLIESLPDDDEAIAGRRQRRGATLGGARVDPELAARATAAALEPLPRDGARVSVGAGPYHGEAPVQAGCDAGPLLIARGATVDLELDAEHITYRVETIDKSVEPTGALEHVERVEKALKALESEAEGADGSPLDRLEGFLASPKKGTFNSFRYPLRRAERQLFSVLVGNERAVDTA